MWRRTTNKLPVVVGDAASVSNSIKGTARKDNTMTRIWKSDRTINRRRILQGLSAASAATVFAPRAQASATALRQNGGVALEVWGGVPEENGPADLISAFEEAHPDISVNYTRYVNDDTGNTQLDTALQGGTPIDVYFTYAIPRMAQRIKAGVAEDLTPYLQNDATLNQWAAETKGIFTSQDKYFSLPTTRETAFLFVNQRLMDEAGIEVATDWTVEDFRTVSEQLSLDGSYGTYAPPDIARMILGPNYWYKEDGSESNFDHPAFRKYLELHRGMIEAGSAFPWSDVLAQNLRAYPQNVFLTEQVASWSAAAWALRYVRDKEDFPHDWVTTFLPVPRPVDQADWYNPGGINNWILMHPKAQNKDAAWTFIQYWMTDGAQYMLKGGKVPAVPGTIEIDAIVEGILGPDADQLFDVDAFRVIISDSQTAFPTDTITIASAEIQQIYQQETDRFLIDEIDLDEWVTTVKEQADGAIQAATS